MLTREPAAADRRGRPSGRCWASAITGRVRPARCGGAGAVRPDAVLIEGPPRRTPLLPLAADQGWCPPVALLAYAPDAPRRAAFWPFAVFSPEWLALRCAPEPRCRCASSTCPPAYASLAAGRTTPTTIGRAAEPASPSRRPRPDDAEPDRRCAPDPIAALARAAGLRRPGALVGRRRRVRLRLAVTVPALDRRDGRAAPRWPPARAARRAAGRAAARGVHAPGASARRCRPAAAHRRGLRRLARPGAGRQLPPAAGRRRAARGLPKREDR